MRNVSNKSCSENRSTHLTFSNSFFFPFENRAVYGIILRNVVQPEMHVGGGRVLKLEYFSGISVVGNFIKIMFGKEGRLI